MSDVKWLSIPQRGLNGHLLFLGSIGSGKTVSMLLPFIEQALENLDPAPSVLALDTKANFISDLFKIIEDKKISDKVLHIRLGGRATINPVYCESPLKNGNFIEIAQNVQAASSNYLGKASESPFWDNSAFNLIKFSIVYCAATREYFTLLDVYSTIVEASNDQGVEKLVAELESTLNKDDFDEEEKTNIEFAIEYFNKEYQELDSKVKSGVMATGSVFLNMFREYQASKLFCPKEADLEIKSFDEILEEGKIIIFDVQKEGLARPMGTFIKLLYLQAVLNRGKKSGETSKISDEERKERCAIVIADEYQDIVTVGGAGSISDVSALAKGRSKKLIFAAATQSYSSLENSIGNAKACGELIQNFKTRICGATSDLVTARAFQDIVGKEETKRESHSISEASRRTERNLILGGFDTPSADITESRSQSTVKENKIDVSQFLHLKTFEAIGFIYDGVETKFYEKIFLKPFFLKKKNTPHREILKMLRQTSAAIIFLSLFSIKGLHAAIPTVCTLVKSISFKSCMELNKGKCKCKGFPFPRPCVKLEYYVPQSFIEVHPEPKTSYFEDLPAAKVQLEAIDDTAIPYGAVRDHGSYSYHAHSIGVQLSSIFGLLACGGARPEKTCFEGMSEHLGENWNTGAPDLWQPIFKAWAKKPKACLVAGAARSMVGGPSVSATHEGGCSVPMDWLKKYPPSTHHQCDGWGLHFPRTGTVQGSNETAAAMMIASRIKSLSSEVFRTAPTTSEEKWQMILPASSNSCFKEGQNMSLLEFPKNINESGRITSGELKGHLFATWKKVSCCVDYFRLPDFYLALASIKTICKGIK